MSNPASNTSTRPMLNTMEENRMRIVYRAKVSEKYKLWLKILGICQPCSCMFCKADTIYQSAYIQVLENHVEWNTPMLLPGPTYCYDSCHCIVPDFITGVFYDTNVAKHAGRAGFCSPIIEMCCFPTCLDLCGEGVTIYGSGIPIICRPFAMIPYVEDAEALISQLKAAKELREGGGSTAPAAVSMTELPQ